MGYYNNSFLALLLTLCCCIQFGLVDSKKMVGGKSSDKVADAEIQAMIDSLRGDFEGLAGRKFDEFTAVSYQSQVVAGTNYFVKVKTGDDEFALLRIFKPLPLPDTNHSPRAVEYNLYRPTVEYITK